MCSCPFGMFVSLDEPLRAAHKRARIYPTACAPVDLPVAASDLNLKFDALCSSCDCQLKVVDIINESTPLIVMIA